MSNILVDKPEGSDRLFLGSSPAPDDALGIADNPSRHRLFPPLHFEPEVMCRIIR
jgi:hypothetical protein